MGWVGGGPRARGLWLRFVLLGACCVLASGCQRRRGGVGVDGTGDGGAKLPATCVTGTESCTCYGNATCNGDLMCLSSRCVRVDDEGNVLTAVGGANAGGEGGGSAGAEAGSGAAAGSGNGGESGCATGTRGCECYGNQTCNDALVCSAGTCVAMNGTGAMGAGQGGVGAGEGGTGAGEGGVGAGQGGMGAGQGGAGITGGAGGSTGGSGGMGAGQGGTGMTGGAGGSTAGSGGMSAPSACLELLGQSDACGQCVCNQCEELVTSALGGANAAEARAVLDCGVANCCVGTDCYCGTGVDLITCYVSQTGPCISQIEMAAGTTDPFTINSACTGTGSACGRARALAACIQGDPNTATAAMCPECLSCN